MIVPSRHYKAVLEELHESHPGMTQIKSVEKMFFFIFIFILFLWWSWIDGDIERTVQL